MTPGVTLAVEFAFPTNELQALPVEDREECLVIPAAPSDQARVVALFLVKSGADVRGRWPADHDMGAEHLADFVLPSGERLYLVHVAITPPVEALADLDAKRRTFSFIKDSEAGRGRFCSVVVNADGSRMFVEGAIWPDKAPHEV
jgi:hypothetical protein